MMLKPLSKPGVVLAFLTAMTIPARAEEVPVKAAVGLDYKIYIGGLEALAFAVTIRSDEAHYDIEIQATTAGMIGRVFPWVIHIGSKGNVSDNRLQPVQHAQTNNFQGQDRAIFLNYDGHGGFLERRAVPDQHEDQRDEVTPELTRDTLDILSGVLAGLRNVDRSGSCNGRVPVFDGRRRFDLVYADDGRETLEPSSVATFRGDTLRCAVKVEPIAGFWRKNQKKFFSQKVNGEDRVVPIEVYIAPVGSASMNVPVRIESTSPFGPLTLNLQGVHDAPAVPAD
jgi:hypothetical protein